MWKELFFGSRSWFESYQLGLGLLIEMYQTKPSFGDFGSDSVMGEEPISKYYEHCWSFTCHIIKALNDKKICH